MTVSYIYFSYIHEGFSRWKRFSIAQNYYCGETNDHGFLEVLHGSAWLYVSGFHFQISHFRSRWKRPFSNTMAALPRTFAASTYNASRVSCIIFSSDPTTAPHAQYNFILYSYIVDQDWIEKHKLIHVANKTEYIHSKLVHFCSSKSGLDSFLLCFFREAFYSSKLFFCYKFDQFYHLLISVKFFRISCPT